MPIEEEGGECAGEERVFKRACRSDEVVMWSVTVNGVEIASGTTGPDPEDVFVLTLPPEPYQIESRCCPVDDL